MNFPHGKSDGGTGMGENLWCMVHRRWIKGSLWFQHSGCVRLQKSEKKLGKSSRRRRRKTRTCPVHGKFIGRAWCGHRRHCKAPLEGAAPVGKVVQFKEASAHGEEAKKVIEASGFDPKDLSLKVESRADNIKSVLSKSLAEIAHSEDQITKVKDRMKETYEKIKEETKLILEAEKRRDSLHISLSEDKNLLDLEVKSLASSWRDFGRLSKKADKFGREIKKIIKSAK